MEHISANSCPGAAQVRVGAHAMLVCPWQFPELLRPDTEPSAEQQLPDDLKSIATVNPPPEPEPREEAKSEGPQAKPAKGKGKGKEAGRGRQEVEEAKGSCSACVVGPSDKKGCVLQ